MNTLSIIGNLTADPEDIQYEKDGQIRSLAKFSIAYNDRNDQVHYFDVVAGGAQAAPIIDVLAKGWEVAVVGSLRQNRWTNAEGDKRSRVEISAREVKFLRSPKGSAPTPPDTVQSDEEPF